MRDRETLFFGYKKKLKETNESEIKKKKEEIKDDFMTMLENEEVQNYHNWAQAETKFMELKEYKNAPEESRKTWYIDYLRTLNLEGDEAAKRALNEHEKSEKKQRMEEAIEKRKRQAEEQRGALGRQLDSERRKHQAGTSRLEF